MSPLPAAMSRKGQHPRSTCTSPSNFFDFARSFSRARTEVKRVVSGLIFIASRSKHVRQQPCYLEDCAAALVALLPHSSGELRSLLGSDRRALGELQFALLTLIPCELESRRALRASPIVLSILREYLRREGSNACGQYMNGVFALATSFPAPVSLSELENLIRRAKRPECRIALIRGVRTIARRRGMTKRCRRLLKEFGTEDE